MYSRNAAKEAKMLYEHDIEILKGQDHMYWLYSNLLDLYRQTGIPCSEVTEDELREILKREDIPETGWFEPPFDV